MGKLIKLKDHPQLNTMLRDEPFLQNGRFNPHGTFEIIHETVRSCVVVPTSNPTVVIKYLLPDAPVPLREEVMNLRQYQMSEEGVYKTPALIFSGHKSPCIATDRLNRTLKSLGASKHVFARHAQPFGYAFGRFSARLFNEGFRVYTDFHPKNFTKEAKGYGILDLASIRIAHIEAILVQPALRNETLAITIAKTFSELTGIKFKLGLLEIYSTNSVGRLYKNSALTDKTIEARKASLQSFMRAAQNMPSIFIGGTN